MSYNEDQFMERIIYQLTALTAATERLATATEALVEASKDAATTVEGLGEQRDAC